MNAGGIHYEPFGIYPGTKSSLDDIAEGDTIAVPNDTTNEARALLLLQDNGILKLKDGAGLTATVLDIEENPYNVEILGIVCAALGRLDRSLWAEAARVLAEVSAMTAGLTEKDFAGVTAENAATVGQKLYIRYGITGVRGQVEAGLPTVLNVGLPVLEAGLAKGYDFDRVGGGALLAILANSTDTNIIARSSRERQLALTEELKALLAQTTYPDKDALAALDDRFIAENLSPGGSADLLALTWLLHFVTTEGNINE